MWDSLTFLHILITERFGFSVMVGDRSFIVADTNNVATLHGFPMASQNAVSQFDIGITCRYRETTVLQCIMTY